jgi:hypothetical protein
MDLYLQIEFDIDDYSVDIRPMVLSKDEITLNYTTEPYVPSKGDKFYFLPGVNIPRIKLKDLSLEHKIKTVRDINDATHIFAGNGTMHKMMSRQWHNTLSKSIFLAYIDCIKDQMDDYYLEKINAAFEHYTLDKIIVRFSGWYFKNNTSISHPKYAEIMACGIADSMNYDSHAFYSADESYEGVLKQLATVTVYPEDALLVHVNGEDAAVIDAIMFEQISDMFKSSDKDNHVLAMEIMANCNYKESLLYIELLFKDFANVISNTHTKNHVNFKSLISYLGKNKNYLYTDIDGVMNSLTDKGVLDIDKINVIMDKYHSEIMSGGDSRYFKVKTVTVNEDTLALLNNNYTYEILQDYQPEVVDIQAEPEEEIEELEIADEDMVAAFTNLERNELKSELIALEEANPVSESELNNLAEEPELLSNNQQIEETNDTDFDWF